MKFQFQIDGWQASLRPVDGSEVDWRVLGSAPLDATTTQNIAMPRMLNRRLGKLPKQVASGAAALPGVEEATYVVCSRHGDFERVLRLLRSLANKEGVSPTDFSLSVHNMLAGVLSIAAENTQAHTAMAAGPDTFVFGMMEALTLLASERVRSVMLLFFDAPLPGEYAGLESPTESASMALAALLSRKECCHGQLGLGSFSAVLLPGHSENQGLTQGTIAQAEAFVRFLENPESAQESRGERIGWRWSKDTNTEGREHA